MESSTPRFTANDVLYQLIGEVCDTNLTCQSWHSSQLDDGVELIQFQLICTLPKPELLAASFWRIGNRGHGEMHGSTHLQQPDS